MKKHTLIITIFIALIIVGGFYWYEYRPQSIRKECERLSQEHYVNLVESNGYYLSEDNQFVKDNPAVNSNNYYLKKYSSNTIELSISESRIFQQEANTEYTKCLRENGLTN